MDIGAQVEEMKEDIHNKRRESIDLLKETRTPSRVRE